MADHEEPRVAEGREERHERGIGEADALVVRMELDAAKAVFPEHPDVPFEIRVAGMDRAELHEAFGGGGPLAAFPHRDGPAEDRLEVLRMRADGTVHVAVDTAAVHVPQLRRDRPVADGTQRPKAKPLRRRHELLAHDGQRPRGERRGEIVRMEVNEHIRQSFGLLPHERTFP